MCKRWIGLLATMGLSVLVLAFVGGAQQATPQATAAAGKSGNKDTGQVLVNGTVVMTLYAFAGEASLLGRAEAVAWQLNAAFAQKAQAKDFLIAENADGWSLEAKKLTVVTATQEDADALKTTPEKLVKFWRTSLTDRMAVVAKTPVPAKTPPRVDPVAK